MNIKYLVSLLILIAISVSMRALHLTTGYDIVTGLPIQLSPFWIALIITSVACVVFAFFYSVKFPAFADSTFGEAFHTESTIYKTFAIVTGFLFIFVGIFELVRVISPQNIVHAVNPDGTANMVGTIILHFPGVLQALLTLLSGGALIVILFIQSKYKPSHSVAFISCIPMFWACFELIMAYNEHGANPIISEYVFELFALISVMYALYSYIGFFFGKPNMQKFVFSSVLALVFSSVSFVTLLLLPSFDANFILIDGTILLRQIILIFVSIFMFANVLILQINVNRMKGIKQ